MNSPNMYYNVPAYDSSKGGNATGGDNAVLTVGNAPNTTIKTKNAGGNRSFDVRQPSLGMNYLSVFMELSHRETNIL